MKHLLNNLTDQEKNAIREQHTGGMKVGTDKFSKLTNSKLGDSKPFVIMEETSEGMFGKKDSKTDKLKKDINDLISQKMAIPKSSGENGKFIHGEREKSVEEILNGIERIISRYRKEKSD